MKSLRYALPLLAGLTLLPAAQAVEFTTVQPAASRLGFTFKQMNVPVEGRFSRFTSRLNFDPAKLAAAKASLEIDLASIDAGSAEANDEVLGKAWFNAKTYPKATFDSTAVRAVGGNRYEVVGKLTIKGRTQEVTAPVTLSTQGKSAVFDGTLPIRRADFAIGEGSWSDFGIVANDVQIRFHLVADAK